jgi:hypothetical protein
MRDIWEKLQPFCLNVDTDLQDKVSIMLTLKSKDREAFLGLLS